MGRAIGLVIAILALSGYLLTLSPGFYPGASAGQVAQHLGLMPFASMANILWGWLVQGVALVPLGSLPLRLNILSALCAAGAVHLLYRLVFDIKVSGRNEPSVLRVPEMPVRILTASMAAVYLACAIPFWIAATRAHPMAFDLLLGLIPFRLVQRAAGRDARAPLFVAAFVYGLSVTEYSSMVAIGPLLALCMLVVLLGQRRLSVGVVLGLLASLLAGLTPYFISAALFMQTPAYVWREFTGYDQVLKYIWIEQWVTLTRSLPRVGWLTIGLLTILPWIIALGYRLTPRPRNAGARFGQVVVHLLIGVVLLLVVWDVPLSPWRTTLGEPLVVIPYVFAAMGMGFVTAFLVEILGRGTRRGPRLPVISLAAALLLMLVPVVAAVRNLPVTSGKTGSVAAQRAAVLLDSLGNRPWMITAGDNDAELALLAHQRGQKVGFINARTGGEAYQNYLASLQDDPRLKGLAQVGLAPLLKEWFAKPGMITQFGVMNAPDIWETFGYQAVPEGLLYTGEAVDESRDPASLVDQFKKISAGYGAALLQARADDHRLPLARRYPYYLNELSRQANNLGVYVEDQDRSDLAEELYRQALGYSSNNLSALINLNALARRQTLPDQEELARQLEAQVKAQEGGYTLWSLSRIHGYVRTPEVFASRGWAWAMSGKPGRAVRELKRAIRAGGDSPAAQLALAQMYFAQDDMEQSEETYRKLLALNPDHAPALLGLARLAARQADYAEARRLILRLRTLNVPPDALNLEESVIEAMAGDLEKASQLLQEVVKRNPDDQRAWMMIALVASQQGDQKQTDTALAKLKGMRNLTPPLRMALAQLALSRRDVEGARRLLEEILRSQPDHVAALNLMVRIHQTNGDREQTELYLNRLLSADPSNAHGNFLLGTLQYLREQYALAEASYRTSLAAERSAKTLNALSYLLFLKGNLDEAEPLVREALKLDDGLANAWDTLGNILLKRSQLPEAAEALQKAVALQPQNRSIQASLVRLYDAQGRTAEAAKLADDLLAKPAEISPSDVQQLRAILKRLRGGG